MSSRRKIKDMTLEERLLGRRKETRDWEGRDKRG
jgi:hypothetical protein